MNYQLITLRFRGRENDFQLWARNENHKKCEFFVKGFEPYFFTSEDANIESNPLHIRTELDHISIFGERLAKIFVRDPLAVEKWRVSFSQTYESDVKFIRRLLIDTGVKNGFSAPDGVSTIYWQDLKPVDFFMPDLINVTLDIEVKTKWRFPDPMHATDMVTAVSVQDNRHNKYITFIVDGPRGGTRETWSDDHVVIFCATEVELFEQVKSYLDFVAGDVIRGWNVFFDLDYLRGRGKVLRVNITESLDRYAHFDQLVGYRRIFRKASNQLKDVVVEEGIAEPEDVIAEGRLLYDENRDQFIRYSMNDVKYCVQIDDKHRLTNYYWRFKVFCGLETFAPTMFHSTKVDTLFLRYAHHIGHYVLPSKKDYGDSKAEESYKGAVVLDPQIGLFEGIGVFDMSRFYPSIIMAYHLSPECSDGHGIYQAIISELSGLRTDYDKQMKDIAQTIGVKNEQYASIKEQRQVVKDLLNSVYGYAGEPSARLYNRDMAAKVTSVARRVILYLKDRIELDLGYRVKYGDTDSLHCQIPFDKCREVEEYANKVLRDFCEQEGVEPLLSIHFEKYYRNELFVEAKGDPTRGAKKYYAANCIWDDGVDVDYIVIKGFDRGGGTSIIGRKVLKLVLEWVIRGRKDEIPSLIQETITKMKRGEYTPNQIAINVGLSMNPDSYKKGHVPPYARGAQYANQFIEGVEVKGGDKIKQFWVRRVPSHPPTDCICVLDESQIPAGTVIDYEEMIRSTIRLKVESIIKVAGISWERCVGARSLLSTYGESENATQAS